MIVDSSALVATLRGDPERDRMVASMLAATSLRMSAATMLEASVVVDRLGDPVLSRRFDDLVRDLRLDVMAVTASQAVIGRAAYRDFGKGSSHPAQLNFGDCFSYALAAETGEPLLFKGDDFIHTDITAAT